jgi:hypothetical protein
VIEVPEPPKADGPVLVDSLAVGVRGTEAAAGALAKAGHSGLERLITGRVPLTRWAQALGRQPDGVKVVMEVAVS